MIFRLFEASDVAGLRAAILASPCRTGRSQGVGWGLIGAKSNFQVDFETEAHQQLSEKVKAAFRAHPDFHDFARPVRWANMRFARYPAGGEYGRHVDASFFRNGGERVRTDIAFTLSLSDPASFRGGDLCLETPFGLQCVRLDAGDALLYPATVAHWVEPVTDGERVVCAGWIQSEIRDPGPREILFDLTRLRSDVPGGEAKLRLEKTLANLIKMWAD